MLKVKLHRLLYGNTLAVHSLGLHSLKLVNEKGEESQDTRWVGVSLGRFYTAQVIFVCSSIIVVAMVPCYCIF